MADDYNYNNNAGYDNHTVTTDNGGFLWGLLGCCVPIAGLVLFLVWKDQKPKTAKAAGIGALVSVIAGVVFTVLYFVFIFIMTLVAVGAAPY